MKHFIFFIGFLFFASYADAQVTVTDDPDYNIADPSALLEVKGTSGGLLLPRLTTLEQQTIQNPAAGLVVFNTDSADFYGFNGQYWLSLRSTDTIRDCPDSIEYSGQWYNVVLIGDQCWMAENLNVGTRIDASQDQTDNSTIEKYCYDNDESNCDTYGGLYQWNEMMQYITQDSAQGICPDGWHIPGDEEWKVLEGTVDTQYGVGDPEWDGTAYRGYDAGKRLKSTSGWYNNGNGTNVFGFTAMPSGARNLTGSFGNIGNYGYFWSATEDGSTKAWYRALGYFNDDIRRYFDNKLFGFALRCLKN